MAALHRSLRLVVVGLFSLAAARAQSLLPPERVPLDSPAAFRAVPANWQLAGGLGGDPRRDKNLVAAPGTGVLVNHPTNEARENLFTAWEHGDLEVDLDFLLPPGGDSGLYLQSRYEVQLCDSWGVKAPKFSDCGGIYQTSDSTKNEGTGGAAPRANACRAPGLWQHLHVEFEAPRFDAGGNKTRNARFARVVLNGFVIHEDVEVAGPTRGAVATDEKPLAPLMIQGNNLNGSVAIRALAVKRREADAQITVEDLHYQLYAGASKTIGDYADAQLTREGALEKFSQAAVEKTGKFALVFKGSLGVPRTGSYAFTTQASGSVRLLIDDRPVIVPLGRSGGDPGMVPLTAGQHVFRADFVQANNSKPSFTLTVESLACPPQRLTAEAPAPAKKRSLPVEVKDRVLAQRSFVPFEPKKRLYAINVGTPAGVHYSYDFETGALLRAWRGAFLDTFEMWDGRGENQIAKPSGPTLDFNAKPVIALIEFPLTGGWPDQPDAMQASQGYTLEANGQPVFLSTLSHLTLRDRIAPLADGRGLARTLRVSGESTSWTTWVLLADAGVITPQPGGTGWIIGDREWYLDWPADPAHTPVVHSRGGKQQLVIRVTEPVLDVPISYDLVW